MQGSSSKARLLFRNIALLEPGRDGLVAEAWLLVEDGRIADSGSGHAGVEDVPTVDGAGAVLMPGLIDCHLELDAAPSGADEYVPCARSLDLIAGLLGRGFTTARIARGAPASLRSAVEAGAVLGPRLLIGADVLGRRPGGEPGANRRRCACCGLRYTPSAARDPHAAARRLVAEAVASGADHISIDLTGHPALRCADELAAMVGEAQSFGRFAVAHAGTPAAIELARRIGARAVVLTGDPGAIAVARAGGQIVVPCGEPNPEEASDAPEPARVAFGSGDGARSGERLRDRARRSSPRLAIESATIVAAEALQLSHRLGTLRPGAHADLLLVDGDPRADIDLVAIGHGLRGVWKGGAQVAPRS